MRNGFSAFSIDVILILFIDVDYKRFVFAVGLLATIFCLMFPYKLCVIFFQVYQIVLVYVFQTP